MISQITVPRPYHDCRAVAHGLIRKHPCVEAEDPQPLAGSCLAGFRTSKYGPEDWFSNYRGILQRAGADNIDAENIQHLSRLLDRDTERVTRQNQEEGTRLLGVRLQDIHSWKSELQRHIEKLQSDTEALMALKLRLERALDATDIPYAIATDNLQCRTRRTGPDLVHDCVEQELLREVNLIRCIQQLLKRTIAEVVCQIKTNRETQEALEMDWSDKEEAYSLDDRSGRMRKTSPDAQNHASSASAHEHVSNPTTWRRFTQGNICKAEQEEIATCRLRKLVDDLLRDTTEDLNFQRTTVDKAFTDRCNELIDAKTQLEIRLCEVLEQIGLQEKNIEALKEAINDREASLRVAQSRLFLRSRRPCMELCRDEAQISLEDEVLEIEAALEALRQKLCEAEKSLSCLEDARSELEKDISCKINSLFIEREKCMSHRRRYPPTCTLAGF